MYLFCTFLGIVFIFTSVMFWIGVGPNFIKIWRDAPEEEKRKVKIDELSKNVSCIFMLVGFIFVCTGTSTTFKENAFVWCMVVWIIITGLDVYFIEKSKRYKNNV